MITSTPDGVGAAGVGTVGGANRARTRALIAIPGGCAAGTAPMVALGDTGVAPEDLLNAMNELAIGAFVCGMTRVLGIALGTGFTHGNFPVFRRIVAGTQWTESGLGETGHSPPEIRGPAMHLIHDYGASLLARIAAALEAVKVRDGSLFDQTLMVYTSDNGEAHHSDKRRWPLAILGSAGGRLNLSAGYRRFAPGSRSLAELWLTVATALDVPQADFAQGTRSPLAGTIDELLG